MCFFLIAFLTYALELKIKKKIHGWTFRGVGRDERSEMSDRYMHRALIFFFQHTFYKKCYLKPVGWYLMGL